MTAPAAGPRLRFGGVVRSEWLKVWTLRANWLMVALAVLAIVAIGPLVELANGHSAFASNDYPDLTQLSQVGAALAELVVGVFGVLTVTNEYASGMIRASLTADPRRWQVVVAKTLVTGGIVAGLAVVSCLIAFFLGQAVAATTPHVTNTATFGEPGVARAVLLDGVYVTLVALLGHGLGWILRNTAGAIATLLGLLLVVPVIFTVIPAQALHDVVAWLPSQAGHDMIDLGPLRSGHSPAVAFVVALAYPAVALVAGGVLLVRRDA